MFGSARPAKLIGILILHDRNLHSELSNELTNIMSIFWIILACINATFLLMFFGGRNAVWGGLTMGAVIGALVAGGFAIFGDSGFLWQTVAKWAICFSLWGGVTEIQAAIEKRKQNR